ncbi:MAG: 2-succinyl-5-enolpyruvyl-6-hydroxy-3-cyclohexene-1-carboxylic-acid synthase [Cyclobacteriaceae bacterium]|nr:2-succinyl-5-enolpyruvyl-6-hydroxy-3-cyclohexene-1-carboxylic-acid synthase [Cyclobacteriaceae bacterium]
MRLQPIYDIAELCARHGIREAILCPGSRCAPLTLAFSRHQEIRCRTISDERSAAFIALGIAQQTNMPVALICTSGSAAYNFAPAIAEASLQEISLLILTADRPREWIDQWDGQTIRQNNIYGNHVKKSFDLPEDCSHPDSVWYINRVTNEALILTQEFPKGPVHINIPLREPLYPSANEKIIFTKNIRSIGVNQPKLVLSESDKNSLIKILSRSTNVLLIAGQQDFDQELAKAVNEFCKVNQAVLVGDVISNYHALPDTIRYADVFLSACSEAIKKALKPDLVITFGKSVISKNLKQFLRSFSPAQHWHIQPTGISADTFQSLTQIIHCDPLSVFKSLSDSITIDKSQLIKKEKYTQRWKKEEQRTQLSSSRYFSESSFNELSILKEIISSLPKRCNLHVANSMSVRYANLIGLTEKNKGVQVYSNRGASGIDGCTSTAVGHALSSDVPNILITGDLAFFYDRNAFWHNYSIPNLNIVVVNNGGGIIFNLIDGPDQLEEKDQYFITEQKLSAVHLANEFGFHYQRIETPKKLKPSLKDFFGVGQKTNIVEIISDQESGKKAFNKFKEQIKKGYES